MNQYKTIEELKKAISDYSNNHQEIPTELINQIDTLKQKSNYSEAIVTNSDTPIYDTLVANYPYGKMPEEKIKCIKDTVNQLLSNDKHSNEPGLLLGKIQCGKTDTFEDIIGLAFDKGIDIAIVFTKGTKPLAQQTIMRMKKDYRFFKPSDSLDQLATINIYDIMNVWNNLKQAKVEGCKTVIVCKKQATNLDHLIEMFTTKSTYLKKKKVLIVDDEADFASRNYRSVKHLVGDGTDNKSVMQSTETEMAKISQQIDDFRKIPDYCRYLQVTATPYCLYLQPQGELNLKGDNNNENYAMPFKPRFTTLVPVHSAYIGGKQYFEDSQNPDSMYSHLFHQIDQKCIDVLGHEDKRYLNASISSGNIYGLKHAIISYFMSTAIRRIQERSSKHVNYKTSALIHVELGKKNHEWQNKIISRLIGSIKDAIVNDDQSDQRIWSSFDNNYDDFLESNKKGQQEGLITVDLPTKDEIIVELQNIFRKNDYHIQIVNSDKQVETLLDEETGELLLDTAANIYIGGNILDRGITIKNMLCFFYGRNPKKFQQDTVLQHARMYGARSKEDMAVTRFHTTSQIYGILSRMNDLDNQLREWFLAGNDNDDLNAIFVGYNKDITPCATQKIKISNIHTIKQQRRIVPTGFWTGTKKEILSITQKIDTIIENHSNFQLQDKNGFFEMDYETVKGIIDLIYTTFVYDDKDKYNLEHKDDLKDLLCALRYCTSTNGGKVYVMQRTNRNMSRLRANGSYIDAPDDGNTDTAPSRHKAIDAPVIMLLRQNGLKQINPTTNENIGWNNAPFYWPVLMTQKNITPAMFSFGIQARKTLSNINDILDGIDPNDVLKLTYQGDLEAHFGNEGDVYEDDNCRIETRAIKSTTATRYLQKDEDGNFIIKQGISFSGDNGLYSYNEGVFPFELRKYKYMLLRNGRDANADEMLLELFPSDHWVITYHGVGEDGNLHDRDTGDLLVRGTDTLTDKNLNETDYVDKNLVQWVIGFTVHKVLKFKQSEMHKKHNQTTDLLSRDVKSEQNSNENRTKTNKKENFGKMLTLIRGKDHLDLVINGNIKIEVVYTTERNISKFVKFNDEGIALQDSYGDYIPIKYDTLRLRHGKASVIIKIKKIATDRSTIYYTFDKILKVVEQQLD